MATREESGMYSEMQGNVSVPLPSTGMRPRTISVRERPSVQQPPIKKSLQDYIDIDELIEKITVKEDYPVYLINNLLINNYNNYRDKIIENVNNPNSPDFEMELNNYSSALPHQPIILGRIKDYKNLNLTTFGKDQSPRKNYILNEYLPSLFKDIKRGTFFDKNTNNIIIPAIQHSIFENSNLNEYIVFMSKLLNKIFGTEEFPILNEEQYTLGNDDDINITSYTEKHLLFNNLKNKPELRKIINAIYLIHQGYKAIFTKVFNTKNINIMLKTTDFINIFDSEKKIISVALYLEDNYYNIVDFGMGFYRLPRGIFILSVNINSIDNDGKIAYIPLYTPKNINPLIDIVSIPPSNDDNEIVNKFIENFIIYYNLLLKNIINLSNNLNLLENLNTKAKAYFIRIKKKTK